jgi:hypothetical protein
MPSSRKFSSFIVRHNVILLGLTLGVAAAALVTALTTMADAEVIVRHARPLPMMVTGSHVWESPVVWIAPPPPRLVVRPVQRPGWIWSPGYWRWSATGYVWMGGVWLAERPGFAYAPAHWEQTLGGWRFIPGGWIRRPL